MAIRTKLDSVWTASQTSSKVFELRAVMQNASNVLKETTSKVDEIMNDEGFTAVDAEIKQTGTDVRNILNTALAALNAEFKEFIDWQQPTRRQVGEIAPR